MSNAFYSLSCKPRALVQNGKSKKESGLGEMQTRD